jgi:hypothetical protein
MSNGGAAAAGAAAAAVIQAIKSAGAVVRIEPRDFSRLVERQDAPLVVHAPPTMFHRSHRYMCSHKGLCFYAKSPQALTLPGKTELVRASRFWLPI